jgi:hypothetical protein
MGRALVTLYHKHDIERAMRWVANAPKGTRLEFKAPKRTIPQNARLWLMLTAISRLDWHGHRYSPEAWKDYFMHALSGSRWMPGEDGGMVPIGRSTSNLSVDEFGDLMTLIEAFCARQGVALPWDDEAAA